MTSCMEKCYLGMAGGGADVNDWNDCFDVLIQIIENERESNPDFGGELDFLDELDMREMYSRLEEVCRKLLKIFEWKEEYPSDIRFMLASALGNQGRVEEARKYCEDWEAQEKDNPLAAAALIYSRLRMKDYEGAEEIVRQYIDEDTVCSYEANLIVEMPEEFYHLIKGYKVYFFEVLKKMNILLRHRKGHLQLPVNIHHL